MSHAPGCTPLGRGCVGYLTDANMHTRVVCANSERRVIVKTCSKCGEEYPATAEYFPRTKQTKSGLVNYCKPCHAARMREWQQQNRDKVRGYNRKARESDPERVRAYGRTYRKRKQERDSAKIKRLEQRIAELEKQLEATP